ncbi:outer membrane beta-barrel protein [Mangrovibacterium sp.]|uniref:outer membrane beta-barrel protein n=1 Tax=Mangrovibacterium sp. TaxID=1961364 RepID=UPI003564EED3
MKKLICFLLAGFLALNVMSQETESKGYLGLMLGPSFPYGSYASSGDYHDGYAQTGVNINLLTFGYEIWKNLGITASWSGMANPLDLFGTDGTMAVGNLMIGPMYSFHLSDKIDLDLRLMVGYTTEQRDVDFYETETANGPSWAAGAMLHYNFAKRWQLIMNLENYQTQQDIQIGKDPKVLLINWSFGAAYRLR